MKLRHCVIIALMLLCAMTDFFCIDTPQSPQEMRSVIATLQECRQALKPECPVEQRRAAALIVGKYPGEAVSEMLMQCLKDPDCNVRRNALVSIGENIDHARRCSLSVLALMADEDVTIRRLVSSMMPHMMPPGLLRDGHSGQSRAMAEGALKRGLGDTDLAVRKNALKALAVIAPRTGAAVPTERLAAFIDSPESSDEDILLAVTCMLRQKDPPADCVGAFRRALKRLEKSPDSYRQLLTLCRFLGRSEAAAILTEVLSASTDRSLQLSVLQIMIACLPVGSWRGHLPLMESIVSDDGLPLAGRAALLAPVLKAHPEKADAYRQPDRPVEFQIAAWKAVESDISLRSKLSLGEVVTACIAAENPSLRQVLKRLIGRDAAKLTVGDYGRIQESAFADVRKAALEWSYCLPLSQRAEILRSGLIDDDGENRRYAIMLLGRLRPAGWMDDLLAALDEENPDVADAAAAGLLSQMRSSPQILQALKDYAARSSNGLLKARILRMTK